MNIEVKISKLRIPYKKAIYDLEKRVEDVKKGLKKELIWILEHPTTYTGGIRSSENEILDKKIKIIKTNRGGKITLHNPGQKIIYFVIDLNKRKKDIRLLLKVIETSIIEVLKIYNINGNSDKKNIGIWVKNKKISALDIFIAVLALFCCLYIYFFGIAFVTSLIDVFIIVRSSLFFLDKFIGKTFEFLFLGRRGTE